MICKGMVDELRYNDVGQRGHPDQALSQPGAGLTAGPVGAPARPATGGVPGMTTHATDAPGGRRRARSPPLGPRPAPPRLPRPHLRARRRRGRGPANRPRTIHVVMSDQRMPGMTGRRGPPPRQAAPPRGDPAAVHRLRRHQGGHRRDQPGERLPLHHQALGPRGAPGGRPPGRRAARPDRREATG